MLHIDIKKLGRFDKIGHRITGDRTQRARSTGWEYVFVAVDDNSRIAFTRLRVPIQRVLTDNGPAFHSAAFGTACLELGITQKPTRAYRPQTNGKAERFIQSALREWACGRAYDNPEQRQAALPIWNHFYTWHRRHHGINCQPPMSRLLASRKNLLTHSFPNEV